MSWQSVCPKVCAQKIRQRGIDGNAKEDREGSSGVAFGFNVWRDRVIYIFW